MDARKGTTLVEAIVYVGILGGIFTAIVSVILSSTNTLEQIQAIRSVNRSGLVALERIGTEMRAAIQLEVATSTFKVDASQLGMTTYDGVNATTTVFYVVNGRMMMFDETNEFALTEPDANVERFFVRDISVGSTTAVQIELTVSHVVGTSSDVRKEFYGTFNARGAYNDK